MMIRILMMLVAVAGAMALIGLLAGLASGRIETADQTMQRMARAAAAQRAAAAAAASPAPSPLAPVPQTSAAAAAAPGVPGSGPPPSSYPVAAGSGAPSTPASPPAALASSRAGDAPVPAAAGSGPPLPNGTLIEPAAARPHALPAFAEGPDAWPPLRHALRRGHPPLPAAIEPGAVLRGFPLEAPAPAPGEALAASLALSPAPWAPGWLLLQMTLAARPRPVGGRLPLVLVFLIDTTGGMQAPDKLPRLKAALRLLADRLDSRDRLALLAYGEGGSGVALPASAGTETGRITRAIDRLGAPPGQPLPAGPLESAFLAAGRAGGPGTVRRVILATDADLEPAATHGILRDRHPEIALWTLALGDDPPARGEAMAALAARGGGRLLTLASAAEAAALVASLTAGPPLPAVAGFGAAVSFDPAEVAAYRVLGAEPRPPGPGDLASEGSAAALPSPLPEFGPLAAGQTLTAAFLIRPARPVGVPAEGPAAPLGRLELHWREAGGAAPLTASRSLDRSLWHPTAERLHPEPRFALGVLGFAALLRGEADAAFDHDTVLALAAEGARDRPERTEFLTLVDAARRLGMPAP